MSPYDAPPPAARALRTGLVLVSVPAVCLALAGVGVLVVAATTRYDMGGWAGLVALILLGGAVSAGLVPALGWILRRQAPRVSAALVVLGGLAVVVPTLVMTVGSLLAPPEERVDALTTAVLMLFGVAVLWSGVRAWRALSARRRVEQRTPA